MNPTMAAARLYTDHADYEAALSGPALTLASPPQADRLTVAEVTALLGGGRRRPRAADDRG